MKLPLGFRSASVAAGLKSTGALDLTIIENQGPNFTAAAVFTTNKVVAAPVTWSRQVAKGGIVRAVVLNSGGANACTGPQGFADTHKTAEHVGQSLNVSSGEVIVCSTGLIGELLPMPKIIAGIESIVPVLSNDGLQTSAQAIMTTDSVPKIATANFNGAEFAGIAVDPYGQTKAGMTIHGSIKRSEFGLTWSAVTEAGNIVVGDEIKLNAELQFIKQ